jgi:simple sugar transport system substrate-binding protein
MVFALVAALLFLGGCGAGEAPSDTPEESGEAQAEAQEPYDIAVFIPGVVAGSPTYKMLADGVERAAEEYEHVNVKVVEAGFNQGEWPDKLTELAATERYELIVSTNPALPEIAAEVSRKFPEQHFLLFDGYLKGNDRIYTFRYNQREQAYLAGHMAALVSLSSMEGANAAKKIGLLAGQEYPDMNNAIRPGFLEGARAVDEEFSLDFRVLGNWYDATKAAEIASNMYSAGSDVILTIAGGANQGVIKAAKEEGAYIHWFDAPGYDKAPQQIIGSTAILQEQAAYTKTREAVEGELDFGRAEVVGVAEGWITFVADDPRYRELVPEKLRSKQARLIEEMERGEVSLEMPSGTGE